MSALALRPAPADTLPRRRFTVAEVEAMVAAGIMAEDERVELIDGDLVPMSAKGAFHETLKVALLRRWYRCAPESVEVAPETTFRLSPTTYLEPDVVLFDRAAGLGGLSGPSVLLVVEIADSSLGYDLYRKPLLYAGFGVRELWVIDAVRRITHLHRDPTPDGYTDIAPLGPDQRLVPRFAPAEFALALADLPL